MGFCYTICLEQSVADYVAPTPLPSPELRRPLYDITSDPLHNTSALLSASKQYMLAWACGMPELEVT